jgi:hypothetical protein
VVEPGAVDGGRPSRVLSGAKNDDRVSGMKFLQPCVVHDLNAADPEKNCDTCRSQRHHP